MSGHVRTAQNFQWLIGGIKYADMIIEHVKTKISRLVEREMRKLGERLIELFDVRGLIIINGRLNNDKIR